MSIIRCIHESIDTKTRHLISHILRDLRCLDAVIYMQMDKNSTGNNNIVYLPR